MGAAWWCGSGVVIMVWCGVLAAWWCGVGMVLAYVIVVAWCCDGWVMVQCLWCGGMVVAWWCDGWYSSVMVGQ